MIYVQTRFRYDIYICEQDSCVERASLMQVDKQEELEADVIGQGRHL